jgi:hypothetical protein
MLPPPDLGSASIAASSDFNSSDFPGPPNINRRKAGISTTFAAPVDLGPWSSGIDMQLAAPFNTNNIVGIYNTLHNTKGATSAASSDESSCDSVDHLHQAPLLQPNSSLLPINNDYNVIQDNSPSISDSLSFSDSLNFPDT